jgi:hypothetical protein
MSLRVDRETQLQVQVVQQLINRHTKGTGGPIPVTLHCNIGSSPIIFENGVHFVSQASIYTRVSESRAPEIRPSKKWKTGFISYKHTWTRHLNCQYN